MMNGILENCQKDLGLTPRQFRDYPDYEKCYDMASKISYQMNNSSIIYEFRSVSYNVLKSYEGDYLEGPTGHRYFISKDSFRKSYPNFLQSYEFGLLAKTYLEVKSQFQDISIMGHFHDGNVLLVPNSYDDILKVFDDKLDKIAKDLGLKYPQRLEVKIF